MPHCYLHMVSRQYIDDILLISCFHACSMTCELFMPTICTHNMLAMIPSSMLHLRTTSLLDLITMIACYVASPMFHYYLLSWVDDIYVHASHVIYLDHCLLCPLVASFISTCIECNHTIGSIKQACITSKLSKSLGSISIASWHSIQGDMRDATNGDKRQ